MELQNGVKRWLVNISEWNPSPTYFNFALTFLPHHLHSSITRFIKIEDRKRALVSRLLQYALVHEVFGVPFHQIVINRTLEGKPYLEHDQAAYISFPNFNFNVSHHGDFVAIASEPICLVGLDIVSHLAPENETISQFIHQFSSYFSTLEWENIIGAGNRDDTLNEFYRYWCVKESFVKAIGTGVGYRLDCVEFHHDHWTNISVQIDGKELKDWRFWLFELGKGHSVSIAKGHPKDATTNYKNTLKQAEFDQEEYIKGLELPNVSFVLRTVEELLSVCKLDNTSMPSSSN